MRYLIQLHDEELSELLGTLSGTGTRLEQAIATRLRLVLDAETGAAARVALSAPKAMPRGLRASLRRGFWVSPAGGLILFALLLGALGFFIWTTL